MKTDYEGMLARKLVKAGLPEPKMEHVFAPPRRWRIDLAYPDIKLALEVEGGTYSRPVVCSYCKKPVVRYTKSGKVTRVYEGGRHTSGVGYLSDLEKYNQLSLRGWLLIRLTPKMVISQTSWRIVIDAYNKRGHYDAGTTATTD